MRKHRRLSDHKGMVTVALLIGIIIVNHVLVGTDLYVFGNVYVAIMLLPLGLLLAPGSVAYVLLHGFHDVDLDGMNRSVKIFNDVFYIFLFAYLYCRWTPVVPQRKKRRNGVSP